MNYKDLLNYDLLLNRDGKANFHTHTFYCDGSDSPEDMVKRAVELGFTSLGFSGHQHSIQDAGYAMDSEKEEAYRRDILKLKEEYKDEIIIYLGIERDYCCEEKSDFQYVIGSCHHVPSPASWADRGIGLKDSPGGPDVNGEWVCVDESPQILKEGIEYLFGGDSMALVKMYYDLEANVLRETKGQIVGHFDLVTKFNSGNVFFDEESTEYVDIAINSCDRIIDGFISDEGWKSLPEGFPKEFSSAIETTKMPIFEINFGAMIKGRRDIPYPAPFILDHLMKRGVPLILSSDCHDRRYLDSYIDISTFTW